MTLCHARLPAFIATASARARWLRPAAAGLLLAAVSASAFAGTVEDERARNAVRGLTDMQASPGSGCTLTTFTIPAALAAMWVS